MHLSHVLCPLPRTKVRLKTLTGPVLSVKRGTTHITFRSSSPMRMGLNTFPRQSLLSDNVVGLLISVQLPRWPLRSPVYLFVYVTQAARIRILFVFTEG